MAGEAVGQSFQHDGALAVAQQLQLTLHSVDNSQRIEAVNSLSMELSGADAGSDTSHNALAHGLTAGLVAHAVGVIEDVVQDGHAIGVGLPQGLVLVHCGEVQSFPNGATSHGSITDVTYDDTLLVVDLLKQSCTGGDGTGAANDSVVGVDTEGQEECVHGAAHTQMEAGLTSEDLRQCTVQDEADSQILGVLVATDLLGSTQALAFQEVLHNIHQLLVGHLVDGGQSLSQNFGVAAVRTECEVVLVQQVCLTDASCFLADRQVSGTGIGMVDAVVTTLGLDRVQHGLELTQNSHITENADQVFLGVTACIQLFLNGLVVLVDGDVLEGDHAGSTDYGRIHKQTLGHCILSS